MMLVNCHMLFKIAEKLLWKWHLTRPLYSQTVLSQSFLTGNINVLYCPMHVIWVRFSFIKRMLHSICKVNSWHGLSLVVPA